MLCVMHCNQSKHFAAHAAHPQEVGRLNLVLMLQNVSNTWLKTLGLRVISLRELKSVCHVVNYIKNS